MRKYLYPCDRCGKTACDYRCCGAYRNWITAAWKKFGRYENRPYWESSADPNEKFLYIHPEVFRRYLKEGPCGRCACADQCEMPCRSYWIWWDARMLQAKRKLQKTPLEREGFLYETNSASRAMKSLFRGHFEVSAKYSFQTSSSRLA